MRTIIIAAAVAAAAFAPAVNAGTTITRDWGRVTARISYADLDLSTPRGVATLERRVSRAMEGMCGSYASAGSSDQDGITDCRRAARDNVAPQMAALLRAKQVASAR